MTWLASVGCCAAAAAVSSNCRCMDCSCIGKGVFSSLGCMVRNLTHTHTKCSAQQANSQHSHHRANTHGAMYRAMYRGVAMDAMDDEWIWTWINGSWINGAHHNLLFTSCLEGPSNFFPILSIQPQGGWHLDHLHMVCQAIRHMVQALHQDATRIQMQPLCRFLVLELLISHCLNAASVYTHTQNSMNNCAEGD